MIKYKTIYINETEKLALKTAVHVLKKNPDLRMVTEVLAHLLIRSEHEETKI